MQTRTISLIALCAALTACNSKSPEPVAVPTDTATEAAALPTNAAAPAAAAKPAPEGLPSRVAREVITASKQACAGVAKAERIVEDGSITATCTSGESYRITTVEGTGPVATKL